MQEIGSENIAQRKANKKEGQSRLSCQSQSWRPSRWPLPSSACFRKRQQWGGCCSLPTMFPATTRRSLLLMMRFLAIMMMLLLTMTSFLTVKTIQELGNLTPAVFWSCIIYWWCNVLTLLSLHTNLHKRNTFYFIVAALKGDKGSTSCLHLHP